jgi:hypothetical protein
MKASTLAAATVVALGLTASIAIAQDAGFGGQATESKNQVPGPGVNNPSDPAAGNPGSPDQIPTAPEVQDDLNDSGASGTSTGETGSDALTKPNSSDPAQ